MIYTYAFTSRKYAFFDDHFFFSFTLSFFLSPSLAPTRARARARSHTPRAHTHTHSLSPLFHACIRLACTYSINREPRYCTASPHLSALVTFTFARVSPHLRFAAVVMLSEATLVRPREQTHRFFRSNKYQQRDSYTGSNPSLSYALINYGLTI